GELFRESQRLGDAAGLVLHAIAQRAAVVAARAEQLDEITHVLSAGDQEDIADAGPDQLFERVIDHRVGSDRQEGLVGDARQLAEPRTFAAGQNHSAIGERAHRLPLEYGTGGWGRKWIALRAHVLHTSTRSQPRGARPRWGSGFWKVAPLCMTLTIVPM